MPVRSLTAGKRSIARTRRAARALPEVGGRVTPRAEHVPNADDRLLAVASRMARVGGWTVNIRDGAVHLSDEACAIHGLPNGTTITVPEGLDFYVPGSRDEIARALAACIGEGTPFELELEIVSKDGRRVPVRASGEAVRDENGSIEAVQGAFQDISAQRAAEEIADRIGVRLTRTLETITDAFYTLDRDWRFTYLNQEAERIQQRTRAELLGRVVWEAFPEAVGTVFDTQFHLAMETRETAVFESYYPPLDLWVSVRAFPSDDGLAVHFLEINDRRLAEQALLSSESRYRALFERAGDAIFIADNSGRFVDANAAASDLLGLPLDRIIGCRLEDFVMDVLDDVDADSTWTALRAAGEMRGEVRLRHESGRILEAEYSAVADISPGLHLGVLRDVTERRRLERSAARRDQILGALRRLAPGREPEDTANAICAEIVDKGEFPSAAIYGFGSEDRVIALGARLSDGRSVDALPPLSGGRMDQLQAKAVDGPWVDDLDGHANDAARARMAGLGIRAVAFAPIESDGRMIGLLLAGSGEGRAELSMRLPALVEFAALASSLLGPGLRRRSERAVERARLRRIISDRAFTSVFQPIVNMSTGAILGYEALTRFADGAMPDRVFMAAADVGVGLELEAATIEAALEASAPLPAAGFLDINVSPGLVIAGEPLRGLLRGAASGVVLEITEHVGIEDYAALRDSLATLGDGVRFAVDDTGAGFASLRHILELAPSHVKLDRALVARIDRDPARQALVAGLVHFADGIDAMLIAEGVETAAERDTLIELGVDIGQGFLLGRPEPAGALSHTRANRRDARLRATTGHDGGAGIIAAG